MLVVLLFLTPALAYMPNAVLAAVVLLIGVKLIDVVGMRRIARVRRGEFAVAAVTACTVVVVGIEQAILLAIALSVVEHITHSYRPFNRLLTPAPDGDYQSEPVEARAEALPGLVIYRFGASLYYANTARFTAEIEELRGPAPTRPSAGCPSTARQWPTSTTAAPRRSGRCSRRSAGARSCWS